MQPGYPGQLRLGNTTISSHLQTRLSCLDGRHISAHATADDDQVLLLYNRVSIHDALNSQTRKSLPASVAYLLREQVARRVCEAQKLLGAGLQDHKAAREVAFGTKDFNIAVDDNQALATRDGGRQCVSKRPLHVITNSEQRMRFLVRATLAALKLWRAGSSICRSFRLPSAVETYGYYVGTRRADVISQHGQSLLPVMPAQPSSD